MDSKGQMDIIKRGTVQIITPEELEVKLYERRPLNIKFGVDPTSPDIHLGHTVPLQKLRQFQRLGHNITLVIGDYTARIGDPSGRDETRPILTEDEIQNNLKTYTDQVFKILDPRETRIVYNSNWLGRFSIDDVLSLASRTTIQQLLQRRDFSKRLTSGNPLTLAELMYPLLVGYDSVELDTDIEIGGTDQLFNFMMSRTVQEAYGKTPEVFITLPLLEGLDGRRKMSKSYGNTIGITDPPRDMYGKLMSISDELMLHYYELLSDTGVAELEDIKAGILTGELNPMDTKMRLARELIIRYHGEESSKEAELFFNRVYRKGDIPNDIEKMRLEYWEDEIDIIQLLVLVGRAKSNSEARRLIEQGGVKIDGEKIGDIEYRCPLKDDGFIIQVGKSYFRRIFP